MHVKILGPLGQDIARLERGVREALRRLAVEATVELVHDARTIVRHGVRTAPALVVDGRVIVAGRVPTAAEVQSLLASAPAA
ncbi:MAG TPA: thioredoxin family protein [Nocardioidaceae bacterium]